MKLTVNQDVDALHFRLVDMAVAESDEIAPGVIVDYDDTNQVVGIEVLYLSKRPHPVNLMDCQFEIRPHEAGLGRLGRYSLSCRNRLKMQDARTCRAYLAHAHSPNWRARNKTVRDATGI